MQLPFGSGQTNRESPDLAFTDLLTGLGNHRRFFDKVDRLISDRADEHADCGFAVRQPPNGDRAHAQRKRPRPARRGVG